MNPETLLERYTKARNEVARCQARIVTEEVNVRTHKAQAETRAISEAGGEKQLGSNEAARERSLAVLLEEDPGYKTAREQVCLTRQQLEFAEAYLDVIKFEMRLYEASLKDEENKAIVHFGTH